VATSTSRRVGGGGGCPTGTGRRREDTEAKVRQEKYEDKDATPNLLLKHPDATLATYVLRQMKHMKHASETLVALQHQIYF
jgi:hypothetical protein